MANEDSGTKGNDWSKFDLQKLLADVKLPGVDAAALLEAHRKNIAALAQANQHAMQGMQALAQRQMEILQQAVKGAGEAAAELAKSAGPKEAAAKQAELAKAAVEQAIHNLRDLAELVGKSSNQAFGVIAQRMTEGLEELKDKAKRR